MTGETREKHNNTLAKKNHPKQAAGSGEEDQDTRRQRVKDTLQRRYHPDGGPKPYN